MLKTLILPIAILISSILFLLIFKELNILVETSTNKTTTPLKLDASLYLPLNCSILKFSPVEREGPSFYVETGGIIDTRNPVPVTLCKLKLSSYCKSKYIADSIDLLLSFNPVYAVYQEKQSKRYETHFNFLYYLDTIGIKHQVVEAILPHRGQTFMATKPGNEPWEIQLHIENPVYYRENLVNVAARKTKDLWEYLLMIDGHQYFDNLYWWEETIWKLEHQNGVQLFQHGIHIDLANNTVPYYTQPSVSYLYAVRADLRSVTRYSGNAWAIKKDVYEGIDYIIDYCLVGGCDGSYFLATIKPEDTERELTEPVILSYSSYFDEFPKWIWNASKAFKGENTYIRGNMIHFYHEEFFSYLELMRKINRSKLFSYERDFIRDENYTLHLANKTLAELVDEYFYGKKVDVKLHSIIVYGMKFVFEVYMTIIRFIAQVIFGYKV